MSVPVLFLYAERKMFLREVTENRQNYGGQKLGNGGIKRKCFNHNLDKCVIQHDVRHHNRAIAK
jgi:hypothetical protein